LSFQFSWYFSLCTMGLVVIAAFFSWKEDTFTSKRGRKVTMGFVEHGGMWGDFYLMASFNGVVTPYIFANPRIGFRWAAVIITVSTVLSLIAHRSWVIGFRKDGITSHIIPWNRGGPWFRDIGASGGLHVVFTACQLALIICYIVTAMPKSSVIVASALLALHLPLGIIEPGWYCSNPRRVKGGDVIAVLWLIAAIAIVVAVKIHVGYAPPVFR
jgi:hypothetical protein